MEAIAAKYQVVCKALQSLEESILFFNKVRQAGESAALLDTREVVYKIARDSVIQRFEFSVELFWKYLRFFLEDVHQLKPAINTPCDVIRTACQAGVLSESDAEQSIRMIRSRNATSHIYKEEIAEQLARDIPAYHEHMRRLVSTMRPVHQK